VSPHTPLRAPTTARPASVSSIDLASAECVTLTAFALAFTTARVTSRAAE